MKSRPEAAECAHHAEHPVVQPNKSALLKRLNRIEGQTRGVAKADVSLEKNNAVVEYDPSKVQVAQLKRSVEEAGFEVAP